MKRMLIAAALTLSACSGSPPARFYVLTPLELAATPEPRAGDLAVGVGPVTLAPHLDRPQIVTRSGNELALGDFDRWAEPLADGIARVLAENLAELLDSDQVWVYPWRPAAAVATQVTVEVTRCDAEDGSAVLGVRWAVFDDGRMRLARRSSYRHPAIGYPATAAALSDALAELSREIAEAVRKPPSTPAPGNPHPDPLPHPPSTPAPGEGAAALPENVNPT